MEFKEKLMIVVISKIIVFEMWKFGKFDFERFCREELVYKMIFFFLFDYEYIKEESERSVGWIVVIVGDIIYIIEENFMVDFDMVRRMIVYESVYVF